ncbi:MAG TPA: Asp23/Gls24 family envelope stress response protein [Streptosporangiaceae bacterium]|nr:Asp23/Gls24 family envelope stress response protein [Streptosporangiaceae bacterium]
MSQAAAAAPLPTFRGAPPGERGRTRIDETVVEKIAAAAAGEVDAVAGCRRRVLGVRFGQLGQVRVRATVRGSLVTAEVAAAVAYPAPLREVTRQVRAHVAQRVRELTGMRVGAVDVAVTALVADDSARVE